MPSFFIIHLKPSVAEGPEITLFQRNLLHAYRDIDRNLQKLHPGISMNMLRSGFHRLT